MIQCFLLSFIIVTELATSLLQLHFITDPRQLRNKAYLVDRASHPHSIPNPDTHTINFGTTFYHLSNLQTGYYYPTAIHASPHMSSQQEYRLLERA